MDGVNESPEWPASTPASVVDDLDVVQRYCADAFSRGASVARALSDQMPDRWRWSILTWRERLPRTQREVRGGRRLQHDSVLVLARAWLRRQQVGGGAWLLAEEAHFGEGDERFVKPDRYYYSDDRIVHVCPLLDVDRALWRLRDAGSMYMGNGYIVGSRVRLPAQGQRLGSESASEIVQHVTACLTTVHDDESYAFAVPRRP